MIKKKKIIENLELAKKKLFQGLSQSKKSRGLFIYIKKNSNKNLAIMLPLFRLLILKKWSVIIIDDNDQFLPKIKDENILQTLKIDYKVSKFDVVKNFFNLTKINHRKREFFYKGTNYYGTIINTLGKMFKLPTYDKNLLDNSTYRDSFNKQAIIASRCLKICEKLILNKKKFQYPVYITGVENSYVPTGIFKLFCCERGYKKNIHYLDLTAAYDYTDKFSTKIINKLFFSIPSKDNLTSGNRICNKSFEHWLNNNKKIRKSKKVSFLNSDYKNIYIFLNFQYDVSHNYIDEGFIHKDMIDFAIDTIKKSKKLNFKKIVLKLHPRESLSQKLNLPVKNLKEMFYKYNIKIIDGNTFKEDNFYNDIDLAVVWRSNVYLDLIKNKIPTIVCGKYPSFGNAFNYQYPKNENDYSKLLSGKKKIKIQDFDIIKQKYYSQYINSLSLDFDFATLPKTFRYKIRSKIKKNKINQVIMKMPETYTKIFDAINKA